MIVGVLSAAFPLLATFAHKGLAVLFFLLVAVGVAAGVRPAVRLRTAPVVLAMGGMLAWAAVSLLWSPEPTAVTKLLGFSLFLPCGLVVFRLVRAETARDPSVWRGLAAGMAVALVGLSWMALIRGPLSSTFYPDIWNTGRMVNMKSFSTGMTIMAILSWVLLSGLRRSFPAARWPWLLQAAVGAQSFAFGSHTAAAAFTITGITLWLAGRLGPRRIGGFLAVLLPAVLLAAPLIAKAPPSPVELARHVLLPGGAQHRLLIWQFAADRILEKPMFGWGFNASRVIPGAEDLGMVVSDNSGERLVTYPQPLLPLHPHNIALQLWLELGAVGAALGGGLAAALALAAGRHRPVAIAVLTGSICVAMGSFGIWQTWWQSGQWILAALSVGLADAMKEETLGEGSG